MWRANRSRWILAGVAVCLIALGAWLVVQREELFGPFTYEGRIKAYFRLLDKAEQCEEQGEVERALSLYQRAVGLAPDYLRPPALYHRASLLVSQNRPREAIVDLDLAIAMEPTPDTEFNSHMFELRAQAHGAVQDWQRAVADADEAIRLQPTAAKFQTKCMILYEAGQRDEALRVASDALAGMPDNVLLLHTRGMLSWYGRDYATAKASLEEAVCIAREQRLNDWTRAWTLSALANYLSTCVEDSQRDGKRAVELAAEACRLSNWRDPDHLEALACARAEAGEFEVAVRLQERAVEASDEAERSQRASILAHFRRNDPYRQQHQRVNSPDR
jgi:tetratricopeptide (TPR) repeat protein